MDIFVACLCDHSTSNRDFGVNFARREEWGGEAVSPKRTIHHDVRLFFYETKQNVILYTSIGAWSASLSGTTNLRENHRHPYDFFGFA